MRWSLRLLILFLLTHLLPVTIVWLAFLYLGPGESATWLTLVAMLIAVLLSSVLYRSIIEPLKDLSSHASKAAEGDLAQKTDVKLPGMFGKISTSLNVISDKLQEFVSRTQAETEVILSEANRLRMILNSINDGVLALDANKQIILFNRAATQITGLSIEDVAGKHFNDVLPLIQNKGLVVSQWIDACSEADMQERSWEGVDFNKDTGEKLSLNVDALYTGADPNGVRTLITFHNRTEEQQIEDMKVDFVALAAHELRTPVTIIKGYIEILEDEIGAKLTPEQRNFIHRLDISAAQLSGSINNILHVSHIEHGELNLQLETADWAETVMASVEELKIKAKVQSKKIKSEIAENLPAVLIDKVSITEVLNNLIDNAIKYSAPGQEVTVRVKPGKSGKTVITEIIDNGVGIPPNAIDKLFTKFYRSHRTRTSHRGTGLGLFMSKSIVEAHNGRVFVESKEGEGSTFGFELPAVESDGDKADNDNITRGVHGWIKNHSLYRG